MTDISREDHDLIDRYLAKRLTETELLMVETRIVEEPGFRNEVELTAALRDGLQELQRRGEIIPLLASPRILWRQPQFAVAASLGAFALGVASFLFFQRPEDPGTVASTTLRFEHTRGVSTSPDIVWQQPAAPTQLQLRFDVGLEPAAAYRVIVERRTAGAAVFVLDTVAVMTADGDAAVTLNSAALASGDYRFTLIPSVPGESRAPVVYALRISDQR